MAVNEIVKIQRPLGSNIPHAPALVYNKDRSIEFFTEFGPELRAAMGEKEKIYVRAELFGAEVRIVGLVEDQPW